MQATTKTIPEQKRVTITSKRQFTIPQKYYTDLGFGKEAICIKGVDYLIIRPASNVSDSEFAEQILTDLIAEGYSGQELLIEFKARQTKLRPAIEEILKEAEKVAHGEGEYSTYSDVFSSED